MSQVIADPKEQFRYAAYLREVSNFLQRRRNKFSALMSETAIVCQDRKYECFHKAVDSALNACQQFEVLTMQYADQLDQKARHGDRYLDVGGALGRFSAGKSGITATAESIGGFELSLGRFADSKLPEAQSIMRAVECRIFRLDQRSAELRCEIAELERELASQSDGDEDCDNSDELQGAISGVEYRLYQVESAKRRIEESASSFRNAQRRMDELLGTNTRQARQYRSA